MGKKWQLHTQNLDTYADFSVRLRNNIGFHTQNLEQKVHLSSKNRIDWDFVVQNPKLIQTQRSM